MRIFVFLFLMTSFAFAQTPKTYSDNTGGVVKGSETDQMRANRPACLDLLAKQANPTTIAAARAQFTFMQKCETNGVDSVR